MWNIDQDNGQWLMVHAQMCGKQCVSCSGRRVVTGNRQNCTVPAPMSAETTAIGIECDQDSLPATPILGIHNTAALQQISGIERSSGCTLLSLARDRYW